MRRGRLVLEDGPQLADEPRLADAGVAHDRDQMRLAALDGAPIGREQELELALAPDECLVQATHAARAHERQRADDAAAGDAAALSLCLDRLRFVELERAARGGDRPLAGEDLARRRRLLEPGGDVHRVAGHERAALAGAADHDLAGVDPDPQLQRRLAACAASRAPRASARSA